ncbi:TPA: multidrug transporter subunit MdtD [Klebsiella pneumoniae subsp. pneumoniae]|uniref:multidrug transporter subunit MdtD n=1 Tax=Klebsiella pneumoniae TaxID=573 RepID=UPI00039F8655|nr:multidrug transporter subunit MdtD [Klebsiella pneumoniae]HBQ5691503.1 multidrug transporter subunit MdtD [Klebsiella pneumoniae subsp. pneumoniae]MEA4524461.1 multidrug transporter subunit MdtD [Klebsiella pneumoniae]MEA4665004.1 multidrug transporter subunit MdtD [Klebsiella pneumoniae]QLW72277.1 multidrug transporter subunit MdtD [Klebsiella pneumoniae]HBQ5707259.1 multidrug transporter subunit MdtD [Klebsiella pneumoniae subsp. pneumoniae]
MSGKKGRSMAGLPWIAAMAFFMQALDATILNTALPAIAHSLNRSPLAMQSAIISYTLTVAMLIPVSGWLADRFGTRRVFIIAVSLFTLGSLACALSSSLTELVIFRVIQGIGGAMMMPVARLALLRAYPRSELLPVLNFVTMPGLVGPILGPVLGGVFVTWASWHWIFLINIPIGVIGILYARKYMPNFTTPRRRFDIGGFLLFGLSLVLFSSGIELFGEKIVATWQALAVIAVSLLLLVAYVRHARRHPTPLISLSLFKTHTFSVGIAGNLATRLGTGCVPFLMPLMLQVGFGYPAIIAGCMIAPTAIGSIIAKSIVTQVLRWFGYRKTLVGITVFIGLMIAQFSLQSPEMPLWMLLLPLFVLGMAMSTQFTAMNTITLADLTDDNASSGNSLLAVTQQLSISLGVAISAAVLRFYEGFDNASTVQQFHYTFITMGVITIISALMFMLLRAKDGRNLISERHKR